ncbi:MAG: TldD/PmbA family protein [Cyanobacteria bacterium SZAS LIN-3]|nr:TldD/PmbA family protein [Cyanobacteria bacterium SZAS LIN-3]
MKTATKTSKKPSAKTARKNAPKAKVTGDSKIAALEAIARFIIDEAAKQGATDCEVGISTGESVDTAVRLGVVEQLEGAQSRGVNFCAYVGQKSATTSTSDFRRPALRKLVKATIAMANASEADPFAGLPDKHHLAKHVPELGLYDPAIDAMPVEKKIQMAIDAEQAARRADMRITNSEGASFSNGGGITVYGNSRGFLGSYRGNWCSLNVGVVAQEGTEMQTNSWYSASRSLAGLESPESLGRTATARAVRQLGARKVKSQVVPVVFDQQMAARLLSQFVGAASGRSIDRKSSFLVGKLNEVVASKLVTIVDDPTMVGKLGSRPFDGEGLPLKRRTIVKEGVLETYLVDAYAARKLKCEPNSGSTGNLHLQAGTQTPEEIIASVKNGLYLTSVSGPGFNGVTGDYSLGASGIWIEDGKLTFPVSGITIASTIQEMFAGIIAVGNDLEFRSGTNSPTILIDKMTVAGE